MKKQSNSRASRYDRAVSQFESAKEELVSQLESIVEDARNGDEVSVLVKQVESAVESFDEERNSASSDVQCLLDEIDSWKSNMEGTNLEYTNKYSMLEDCMSELETAQSDMEDASVSLPFDQNRIIDGTPARDVLIEGIEDMIADAEGFEVSSSPDFPGMFG